MTRWRFFSTSLSVATSILLSISTYAEEKKDTVLRWKNGESINGEIIGGTASELTWKSPLFEEPIGLQWSAIRRIDGSAVPAQSKDPFVFILRDGSFLHGDLVSIGKSTLMVRSTRHGELALKRSEVISARRKQGAQLQFSGPVGDTGWDSLANWANKDGKRRAGSVRTGPPSATVPKRLSGPGGALLMPYWNTDAYLGIELPEMVDVEFRVRSSSRPEFQLALEASNKQRLRIETWDSELVLAVGEEFQRIRTIDDSEREVSMRVEWDRKSGKCAIRSAAGELILEWTVPTDPDCSTSGVMLLNKGKDLALEFLRVRTWDGKAPAKVNPDQLRVELADGRIIQGELEEGPEGSIKVSSSDSKGEDTWLLSQVDAVEFGSKVSAADWQAKLDFVDSTILMGRPAGIADGRVMLQTAFADQPVASSMDGLRQMNLQVPAAPGAPAEPGLSELDQVTIGDKSLHGTLIGTGGATLSWRLVGSTNPVAPAKQFSSEFNRAQRSVIASGTTPALLYLNSGDVIPARLVSIDRNQVEIESDWVDIKKVPVSSLDAVQFDAPAHANFSGFDDSNWRVLKGDKEMVRRDKGILTLDPGAAIMHPTALFADEVSFSFNPNEFSAVRLRLFSGGSLGDKSTNLIVAFAGNRIVIVGEAGENQFNDEYQAVVPSDRPVPIRIGIGERSITVSIAGNRPRKYQVKPDGRSGVGMIIEPASMWGNSVTTVQLSDFSTRSEPGHTWLPNVSPETRERALFVPRFRKDDAPRHALLAANGDVLRGEIEAVTPTHLGFRSGLENLRIPRDRVKAAIWLKKPGTAAPVADPRAPVLAILDRQIEGNSQYGSTSLSTLIGFLRNIAPELKFKLPNNESNGLRRGFMFGNQTVGEALDGICAMFRMRYRIDDDSTIVVEPIGQTAGDLSNRLYWMKSDPFKNAAPAEALTSKGILFPKGATVSWNPESLLLSMNNTAANHAKLAEVLRSEFGGSAGSPTHWLLLTNGGRFGIVVDRFDTDAVVGHHPVYGQCKVPLSQVFAIRSSLPAPTAAMKAVGDWRLVAAPEPVLPDSPGDSSPLLGKDAKTFKLKLLDGSEFDLSKEKGKVVVLDFWATWCGPCVKSLPGLMNAVSKFPSDRVRLIGLNQGEPPDHVKEFLESRGWSLTVALDSSQSVGAQYGVDGIPHTVVVGPDGKVAWVHTGYSADGDAELTKVVQKLLEGSQPNSEEGSSPKGS